MVTWWTSQQLGPEDTGDERILSVSGYRLHSWSLWVCHVMKERLARWTNHVCHSEPIGQVPESYKGFVHNKRIVHDWHSTSRQWIECSRLCHRIQFQTQTLCINCISVLINHTQVKPLTHYSVFLLPCPFTFPHIPQISYTGSVPFFHPVQSDSVQGLGVSEVPLIHSAASRTDMLPNKMLRFPLVCPAKDGLFEKWWRKAKER